MDARCRPALFVLAVSAFALAVAPAVHAQGTAPSPAPARPGIPLSDGDRALLQPLVEIGRVRAASPYCAALARARSGSDSAVAYEYLTPQLAKDLRSFRFDSELHQALALKASERDLNALWALTLTGRNDLLALRTAAKAPGVGPEQAREMLAFADAVDGAKQREQLLAKDVARVVAVYGAVDVRTITRTAHDAQLSSDGLKTKMNRTPGEAPGTPTLPPNLFSETYSGVPTDAEQQQRLFSTFAAESLIRDDLRNASDHAARALALGGCTAQNPLVSPAPSPSP